jgi:hypothetical protein
MVAKARVTTNSCSYVVLQIWSEAGWGWLSCLTWKACHLKLSAAVRKGHKVDAVVVNVGKGTMEGAAVGVQL